MENKNQCVTILIILTVILGCIAVGFLACSFWQHIKEVGNEYSR